MVLMHCAQILINGPNALCRFSMCNLWVEVGVLTDNLLWAEVGVLIDNLLCP